MRRRQPGSGRHVTISNKISLIGVLQPSRETSLPASQATRPYLGKPWAAVKHAVLRETLRCRRSASRAAAPPLDIHTCGVSASKTPGLPERALRIKTSANSYESKGNITRHCRQSVPDDGIEFDTAFSATTEIAGQTRDCNWLPALRATLNYNGEDIFPGWTDHDRLATNALIKACKPAWGDRGRTDEMVRLLESRWVQKTTAAQRKAANRSAICPTGARPPCSRTKCGV